MSLVLALSTENASKPNDNLSRSLGDALCDCLFYWFITLQNNNYNYNNYAMKLVHLLFKVKSDVGELLLDVTNDFTLGGGGEGVSSLGKDLHEVISKITSGKIETKNGVGKSISFVDGDGVGNSISRVQDDSGGTSRSIEGQDGLDGNVHGGGVEGLKHDLSHLLTVGLRVKGSLGKKDGVFLRSNTEFVVEGVVPDLLHIIPVGDDSMLNGVFEGQDTSLGLGFISNIRVLLSHSDHDSSVSGSSDDGGEYSAGGIVSGKSGFAHSRSVINNKSLNVVFHFTLRFFDVLFS